MRKCYCNVRFNSVVSRCYFNVYGFPSLLIVPNKTNLLITKYLVIYNLFNIMFVGNRKTIDASLLVSWISFV